MVPKGIDMMLKDIASWVWWRKHPGCPPFSCPPFSPLAVLVRPLLGPAASNLLGFGLSVLKCLAFPVLSSLGLLKDMPHELGSILPHIKESSIVAYCVFNGHSSILRQ